MWMWSIFSLAMGEEQQSNDVYSEVYEADTAAHVSGYVKSVLATGMIMPVTYGLGRAMTLGSNQLVAGMLPSVLTGIVLPSGAAILSSQYFATSLDLETRKGVWASTLLLNTGIFTGATVQGLSVYSWKDQLLFGAVSAVLLPVPSWLLMHPSLEGVQASVWVQPTVDSDKAMWQFSIQNTF